MPAVRYDEHARERIYKWREEHPEEQKRHNARCWERYRERNFEKFRLQRNLANRRYRAKHLFNMTLEQYDAHLLDKAMLTYLTSVRNLYPDMKCI